MHNKRINTLIHVLKIIYNYIITILVQHTHTHTLPKIISKEAVGNSWDILNAILSHL